MAAPDQEETLAGIMFEETSTIGLRTHRVARRVLGRESVSVSTPYGRIGVKVARHLGRVVNVSPEYEDCARAAREAGEPYQKVRDAAMGAWVEGASRVGAGQDT
jgi:hypothetical protein